MSTLKGETINKIRDDKTITKIDGINTVQTQNVNQEQLDGNHVIPLPRKLAQNDPTLPSHHFLLLFH